MSTATESRPEPGGEGVAEPAQEVAAEKVIPWPGQPHITTPLGVLQGRFDVVDFLIRKELDEISSLKRQRDRCHDRLYELGKEREALKKAAAALSDEADIHNDERIPA